MVDGVEGETAGAARAAVAVGAVGGFRASQPEDEFPLQTRCRSSGAVIRRTTTSRRSVGAVMTQPFPTKPVGGQTAHGTKRRGGRTI